MELLNAGKLNDINEATDEQNSVEGEEVEETAKTSRPIVEEAHPELNADSTEESKKASYNIIIKKVNFSLHKSTRFFFGENNFNFVFNKSTTNGQLSEEEERALLNQYQYTGATTNIHPLLSSIVNYAQPVKFQGFEHSKKKIFIITCLLLMKTSL